MPCGRNQDLLAVGPNQEGYRSRERPLSEHVTPIREAGGRGPELVLSLTGLDGSQAAC